MPTTPAAVASMLLGLKQMEGHMHTAGTVHCTAPTWRRLMRGRNAAHIQSNKRTLHATSLWLLHTARAAYTLSASYSC
jgi:hypothetical protein